MNPPPIQAPVAFHELTHPKERTYFVPVLIFSILVWAAIVITVFGLFYAALFALLAWLGSGLLIAHLRSETVQVDERQMPRLHATFAGVCSALGITERPELYVLQAGGALNAFATKFAGRDFVVVYSDLLETFGPESAEIKFILGHELGHVRSNHVLKRVFLAPGIFLPLLGAAYLRACESSCDRHGAFAAEDIDGSVRAMLTLGGGKILGKNLEPTAFARQHYEQRGFFVSWHELSAAYPTLSQRVARLLSLRDPQFAVQPSRNPFAYLFALATPGGRMAGSANGLVFIVIIGMLAAMAVPAFQKVRLKSLEAQCFNQQRLAAAALEQYTIENGHSPKNLQQLVGPGQLLKSLPTCPSGGHYEFSTEADGTPHIECSLHGAASGRPEHR